MKLKWSNIILIFFLLFSLQFISSCSKKQDWTTTSDEALSAFLEGLDFVNRFNRDKALECFNRAYSADTSFAIVMLYMADSYMSTGMVDSARYFLKKSYKLKDNVSRYEQLIINQSYNSFTMNAEKAKSYEDTLLTEFPHKLSVIKIKAQKAFQKGDYSLSRQLYFEILEQNPDFVMAYNMIAYSYTLQGYFRDAYDYFYKYMQMAPDILNPYDSMAEFYLMTGKYHEAISLLEKLVAERQDLITQNKFLSTIIYLKIADGYKNLGQYKKAEEYALTAKEMYSPIRSYHEINHFRFFLYKELGNVQKMQEEYDWFKGRVSNFLSSYYGILIDIANYNYSAAEKRINDFCSKNQHRDKAYIRFLSDLEGELAFTQNRFAVAADKFKSAFTVKIGILSTETEIKSYISQGLDENYDVAIEGFQKILNKNPNQPTSLYYISRFYYENSNPEKAKTYLNHFLTIWSKADENAPLMIKARELQETLSPTSGR